MEGACHHNSGGIPTLTPLGFPRTIPPALRLGECRLQGRENPQEVRCRQGAQGKGRGEAILVSTASQVAG